MSGAIPVVEVEKPALPTLWLDTSVVIKLTKLKRGEALQEIEVQRGTRLQKLVFELVRSGKLLCPESDQEEEYAGKRIDDDVHSMLASLSLGISLAHREGILDRHVLKGMEAYARKSDSILLPSASYFDGDPVRELERTRHERYIVHVGVDKGPDMLKRRANSKEVIGADWELLRERLVAKGQAFEKQLKVEQHGYLDAMAAGLRKFQESILAGRHDVYAYFAAHQPLLYRHFWATLRGDPPDWEGVANFFRSPHFSELPQPFIGCRLVADLLTGNEPIEPSDPMDVQFLEIALPVAHFVLTDKRMERRVKRLKLDSKYGASVYSMSSIEGLLKRLANLKYT